MKNYIIERLIHWASIYPYRRAVFTGEKEINYRELLRDVSKIALWMKKKNISREDIAVIYMERSYESVCAALGILAAGAAFLPIDVKIPVDRMKYMLDVSEPKCLLKKGGLLDFFPTGKQGDIDEILSDTSEDAVLDCPQVRENDLVYVIFTSGSTGLPKGVMVEYGGMRNHQEAKINILNLDERNIIAHNAPICFDISVWQILSPVCVGGTIRIFSESEVRNVKRFVESLRESQVTILETVPSYLNMILKSAQRSKISFPELAVVLSTGEVLTKDLVKRWFEQFRIPLLNAYGPTEASDDVTHCFIFPDQNYDDIPIGEPIANVELFVADGTGALCKTDECGELFISGICVARGYINDTKESRKSFFIDSKTGQRTYRTGDLAKLGVDGSYRFYGRVDSQIKIHGCRIEVREIENVMEKYEGILEAMVVYLKEADCLAACIVSEKEVEEKELKLYLGRKLPEYMIPSIFFREREVPYLASGKLDYEKGAQYLREKLEKKQRKSLKRRIQQQTEWLIQKYIPENTRAEEYKRDLRKAGFSSLSIVNLMVDLEEFFHVEIDETFLKLEQMYDLEQIVDFIVSEVIKRDGGAPGLSGTHYPDMRINGGK